MHRIARAAQGLQGVAARTRLSSESDATSAWRFVRRSSYLSPEEFTRQTLGNEVGESSQARPSARTAAHKSRRAPSQTEGGTENGADASPYLPTITRVTGTPLVNRERRAFESKFTIPRTVSQVPEEYGLDPHYKRDPRRSAWSTPVPGRLVQYHDDTGRVWKKKPKAPLAKPLILEFGRLAEGTTAQHVVKAISDAAIAHRLDSKTTVVDGFDQLPSGIVRVKFLYSYGLRETLNLARAGGLPIAGPAGPAVQAAVSVCKRGITLEHRPRHSYDPRSFKPPDRQGPDNKSTLVRRIGVDHFRAPPNFTGSPDAPSAFDRATGGDGAAVPPKRSDDERVDQE